MAKKSAKKASKKPAVMRKSAASKAATNGKAAKATKRNPIRKAAETASHVPPAFGTAEIKKIRRLLRSNSDDGLMLGVSLLESLGATRADYEAVFTETVMRSILNGWEAESWRAVAEALVPHKALSKLFHKLVEEKSRKRLNSVIDFECLIYARVPTARAGFLATWGDGGKRKKQFIDLVHVPAGSFVMGSPKSEADRKDDENQVKVRITKPFAMSRTVVTHAQWRAVMGTELWRYYEPDETSCGDDFPVVNVNWFQWMFFCQTLTDLERETGRLSATQSYQLPTEAQWEYACRAGTTTAYSFGDDPKGLAAHGWYDDNTGTKAKKVAGRKPNPWGFFDMHGSVNEWCADWYADKLAGGDDPAGPTAGNSRVYRGGDWVFGANFCRSACRLRSDPACPSTIGARIVLVDE